MNLYKFLYILLFIPYFILQFPLNIYSKLLIFISKKGGLWHLT